MSHEVESMAYFGATPWHGLGCEITNLDALKDSKTFMIAAGLDWKVAKVEINWATNYLTIWATTIWLMMFSWEKSWTTNTNWSGLILMLLLVKSLLPNMATNCGRIAKCLNFLTR